MTSHSGPALSLIAWARRPVPWPRGPAACAVRDVRTGPAVRPAPLEPPPSLNRRPVESASGSSPRLLRPRRQVVGSPAKWREHGVAEGAAKPFPAQYGEVGGTRSACPCLVNTAAGARRRPVTSRRATRTPSGSQSSQSTRRGAPGDEPFGLSAVLPAEVGGGCLALAVACPSQASSPSESGSPSCSRRSLVGAPRHPHPQRTAWPVCCPSSPTAGACSSGSMAASVLGCSRACHLHRARTPSPRSTGWWTDGRSRIR